MDVIDAAVTLSTQAPGGGPADEVSRRETLADAGRRDRDPAGHVDRSQ